MSNRKVNLGESGETPKKVTSFSIHAEPTSVPRASPGSINKYSDYGLSPSASPTTRAKISPEIAASMPKPVLKRKSKYEHPNPNASPVPTSRAMPSRPDKMTSAAAGNSMLSPNTLLTKENTKLNAVDRSASYMTTDGRPKTSRGKSCPSPDEFFDYVIPSPQKHVGFPGGTLPEDPATTALINDYQTLFTSMGMAPPPASAFRARSGNDGTSGVTGRRVTEVQQLVIDSDNTTDDDEEEEEEVQISCSGQPGQPQSESEPESEAQSDDSREDGSGNSDSDSDSDADGYEKKYQYAKRRYADLQRQQQQQYQRQQQYCDSESDSESESGSGSDSGSGGAQEGRNESESDSDSDGDSVVDDDTAECSLSALSTEQQREREIQLLSCWLFACALKA